MAKKRVFQKAGDACYHCISRTVNGEFLLHSLEARGMLQKQMQQIAEFCGVEIVTFCILSNHFHLLVRVPDKNRVRVSDEELLRRFHVLYPNPTKYQRAGFRRLEEQLARGGVEAESVRQKLLRRMHDISEFMKTLKQRFSIWYNQTHDRFGTLWAERYKCVLVQGEGFPLLVTSLYIDLNPVRAGITADPKDYPFSGYADAVAGRHKAIAGIKLACSGLLAKDISDEQVLAIYRMRLFGKGSRKAPGKPDATIISREKAAEVIFSERGRLPMQDALRCRMRHFTDGIVLGDKRFVQEQIGKPALSEDTRVPGGDGFEQIHTAHRLRGQSVY